MEAPIETSPKRRNTRNLRGAVDGVPFSKDNQPTKEEKSNGWAKKRTGRELAKAIMELPFKGTGDSKLKKAAAEYYGVPESSITVEQMMWFRQIEKSVQKADTPAFIAVMDRRHGKPSSEEEPKGITINQMIIITRDEQTKEELKNLR